MATRLSDIRDAIRRAWPNAWTQSGFNERLDAPAGTPGAWRPWWSSLRRGVGLASPRRWSGQSFNERLADRQRRRR